MKYRDEVRKYVTDSFNDGDSAREGFLEDDTIRHIIDIGISVVETKFPEIGPGFAGGGFVQAVVDNDLMRATGTADHICSKHLKFFCVLLYNFSPHQLKGYTESLV
jgi:hypothetical protein